MIFKAWFAGLQTVLSYISRQFKCMFQDHFKLKLASIYFGGGEYNIFLIVTHNKLVVIKPILRDKLSTEIEL